MNLEEAIALYRSKPKSSYPAENWVRIGQYLEPHIDQIEWLSSNRAEVATKEINYYKDTIRDLRDNVKILQDKNDEFEREIMELCKQYRNNPHAVKSDLVNAIYKYYNDFKRTPSV